MRNYRVEQAEPARLQAKFCDSLPEYNVHEVKYYLQVKFPSI